jgi:hypothetical protein
MLGDYAGNVPPPCEARWRRGEAGDRRWSPGRARRNVTVVLYSSALYLAVDRSKESVLPVVKKVLNFYVGVYANQRLIFSL